MLLAAFILVLLVITVVLVALQARARKRGESDGMSSSTQVGLPYLPAQALFSAAEAAFLSVLDQAAGPEHRVFGKVRIADVAMLKPGLSPSARQGALNKIASKHFDFVVCRVSDLAVVCAVELNDASHKGARAQARDELVSEVCRVLRLPLLAVTAARDYDPTAISERFRAAVATFELKTSA